MSTMSSVDRRARLPLVEETPTDSEAPPWNNLDDAAAAAAVTSPVVNGQGAPEDDSKSDSPGSSTGVVAGAVATATAAATAGAAAAAAYLGLGGNTSPLEESANEAMPREVAGEGSPEHQDDDTHPSATALPSHQQTTDATPPQAHGQADEHMLNPEGTPGGLAPFSVAPTEQLPIHAAAAPSDGTNGLSQGAFNTASQAEQSPAGDSPHSLAAGADFADMVRHCPDAYSCLKPPSRLTTCHTGPHVQLQRHVFMR